MDKSAVYHTIGENIRRLRVARGLKQADLADQVGMSRTSVTNVELGRQRLLVDQLLCFASVLGTQPVELLPSSQAAPEPAAPAVTAELSAWLDDLNLNS